MKNVYKLIQKALSLASGMSLWELNHVVCGLLILREVERVYDEAANRSVIVQSEWQLSR